MNLSFKRFLPPVRCLLGPRSTVRAARLPSKGLGSGWLCGALPFCCATVGVGAGASGAEWLCPFACNKFGRTHVAHRHATMRACTHMASCTYIMVEHKAAVCGCVCVCVYLSACLSPSLSLYVCVCVCVCTFSGCPTGLPSVPALSLR